MVHACTGTGSSAHVPARGSPEWYEWSERASGERGIKYTTARPPLASAELLESVGDWESGSQHVEDYRSREDYQDRRTCVLLKHRCDRCEHDEQGVNELTQNAQKPLSPAASA